ncbi:MAG: type II secretion system F family protein [Thermoproteus sp. AZ2]|uniref:Type II secretion system F family protein n=1 Tax=Thermoproteus sp. AZ2 TaxID=1609232 RepID=A0ACC6V086_9CREN
MIKGIERTDLDPLRFRQTVRLTFLGGLGMAAAGAFLTLARAFPLGPLFLGLAVFLIFLPKVIIGVRTSSIRELLNMEIPFLTVLIQMTFATKAPLDLAIQRMMRYRELPGIRTLAVTAWNNTRMLGIEPLDALKRAVEKLAPQKLIYRFNSLYTALRVGEDIIAKLSLYMDMDMVEFSSNMQRRMDSLVSTISSLVVGLAMLSVTAIVIGRGNAGIFVLMGGLLPAVMGVVMGAIINIPLLKMDFKIGPLIFAVLSSVAMIVLGFVLNFGLYTPLAAAAVAGAGYFFTKERVNVKSFERGFMDFAYVILDELKRSPSIIRAMENAVMYGNFGDFTPRAAAILNAVKSGVQELEDVVTRDMQPIMSIVVRIFFDIYRLGTLPRSTVDQLQNFVAKLFEYREQLGKSLGVIRLLALLGAAMVAFVNASMMIMGQAASSIAGGTAAGGMPMASLGGGGIGMGYLYLSFGLLALGYYFLFAKISFSTRGGLIYTALLYITMFIAIMATTSILKPTSASPQSLGIP